MIHQLALVAGVALLGVTAHATISASGGYDQPHALVTIGIAVGVAIAAVAIGSCWRAGRKALATWLILVGLAGEAFGLVMTAERLIVSREAAQAPLRASATDHQKAYLRVRSAETALANLPATNARLEAALAAKAAADASVVEKSSARGCLQNCRLLLQAQVDAADKEVAAARGELMDRRLLAGAELDAARSAAGLHKAPPSATPLADRIGVPAWVIDPTAAVLGSLAANGLGCGLIAFAAHARREERPIAKTPHQAVVSVDSSSDHLRRFAFDRVWPAPGDELDMRNILTAYRGWCSERGQAPLQGAALAQAVGDLFDNVGIQVIVRDGSVLAMGVGLKAQPTTIAPVPRRGRRLGDMARLARAQAAGPSGCRPSWPAFSNAGAASSLCRARRQSA